MKLSEKLVIVFVGLSVFLLGYLVFLMLCNYIVSTAK